MKKIITAVFMSTIVSTFYASDTGTFTSSLKPFISLEGAYNWRSIDGALIRDTSPIHTNQPWGGRAALGVAISLTKNVGLTNEFGWNYFGKTTINEPKRYINISTLDGVDLLVGILYKWNKTEWFVKGGGLAQNIHTNHTTLNYTVHDREITPYTKLKNTETQMMPEIKIGGIYNINKHLGISLSCMQAFGSTFVVSISADGTINKNFRNPTSKAILAGLRYTI